MRIKTLNGTKPHPDWGGWSKFLKTCELRGTSRGVKYYGKTNCNYILFPDGTLVENYGFHGRALLARVKSEGAHRVLVRLKKRHEEFKSILREAGVK